MPSTKAQLGARVPHEVRAQAIANAHAKGVSLNVYIEDLIMADERAPTLLDPVRLEGQTDLVEMLDEENAAVQDPPADGLPQTETWKRFEQNCSMGAYHWRCGPGNPCRRCGGEI